MVTLPPLSRPLGQMTQTDVISFIPQMMKSATGRTRIAYGKQNLRPQWWPKEVPWANPKYDGRKGNSKMEWLDALRLIIYSCYAYHGVESMLLGELHQGSPATSGDEPPINKRSSRTVNFVDDNDSVEGELSLDCPNTGALHDLCPSPAIAASIPSSGLPQANSPTEQGKTGSAEKPYLMEVHIYSCYYCSEEYKNRLALQKHQQECGNRIQTTIPTIPLDMIKTDDDSDFAESTKINFYSKEKVEFMEHFMLYPRGKVHSIEEQRRSKQVDIDCQIIDLDQVPDPIPPRTPNTPRSKSLIAQLSRDMSPSIVNKHLFTDEQRRMSLCERRPSVHVVSGENSDAESEKSEEEEEVKLGRTASLLYIAVSSLLGQRIKKHVCGDKNNNHKDSDSDEDDGNNYDSYCHTPKKDVSQGRLRSRPNPFPVTFKPKKGYGLYVHKYKFNSSHKKEFYATLAAGLDKRSRRLKSKLKPCRMVVENLSTADVEKIIKTYKSASRRLNSSEPVQQGVSGAQLLSSLSPPGFVAKPGPLSAKISAARRASQNAKSSSSSNKSNSKASSKPTQQDKAGMGNKTSASSKGSDVKKHIPKGADVKKPCSKKDSPKKVDEKKVEAVKKANVTKKVEVDKKSSSSTNKPNKNDKKPTKAATNKDTVKKVDVKKQTITKPNTGSKNSVLAKSTKRPPSKPEPAKKEVTKSSGGNSTKQGSSSSSVNAVNKKIDGKKNKVVDKKSDGTKKPPAKQEVVKKPVQKSNGSKQNTPNVTNVIANKKIEGKKKKVPTATLR